MGLLEKLMTVGGVALAGVLMQSAYQEAQETRRRRESPLSFDDDPSRHEFAEIVRAAAQSTARVTNVDVSGMMATIHVRSNSGLTTWSAEVDFNDYGRLTGAYWLKAENTDSIIPEHFAKVVQAQIKQRVA
jgi:hypothetical protein